MKKILIIGFFFLSTTGIAQTSLPDSVAINNCETQGNHMAKLLMEKNYDAFIKFTYPPLVKKAGGAANMIKAVSKGMEDLEKQGYLFTGLAVDKPEKIVRFNKQLQCVVVEHIEMKIPGARVSSNASLIGISTDNGKNWTFIDTHGADLKTVQKSISGLSNDLLLPEKEKPVVYKD